MSQVLSHVDKINLAAQTAETGRTAADVRNYIAILVDLFLRPGTLRDLIAAKVGDLQLRYMNGHVPPVTEEALVKALNRAGDQIGLPDYGKTNPLEFRLLRVQMLESIPNLNPAALTRQEEYTTPNGERAKRMTSEMSPAEATYLVCLLALQKRLNPGFQKTEAELNRQRIDFDARKDAVVQKRASTSEIYAKDKVLFQPAPEREAAINAAMKSFAKRNSDETSIKSFLQSLLKEVGYAE